MTFHFFVRGHVQVSLLDSQLVGGSDSVDICLGVHNVWSQTCHPPRLPPLFLGRRVVPLSRANYWLESQDPEFVPDICSHDNQRSLLPFTSTRFLLEVLEGYKRGGRKELVSPAMTYE